MTPATADSIRATLERPPGNPPFDAVDAVSLPFKIILFPVRLVGLGLAHAIGYGIENRPQGPGLLDKLREQGVHLGFGGIGPRSGISAIARYEGAPPLFVEAAFSIRTSQRYRIGLAHQWRRNSLAGGYQFLRNAEPRFWGIGPNTSESDRTDYLWDQQNVAVTASTAARFFSLNAQAAWEDNRIDRGTDGSSRDLQDVVAPGSLFGLNERTRYVRLNLGTTLDFTRQHRFHRSGAILQLGSAFFFGTGETDSDFHAFDVSLRGFVPINSRQSFAGQILTEITRADSGRGVPFYHLASLGSSRGARSLDSDRFRDNDMAALMLEWRYEIWRELHESARAESFLFFDTGTVAERLDKLRFDELKYSWGFGFRLIALPDFFGSTFIALGTEGPRFRVVFSTIF